MGRVTLLLFSQVKKFYKGWSARAVTLPIEHEPFKAYYRRINLNKTMFRSLNKHVLLRRRKVREAFRSS